MTCKSTQKLQYRSEQHYNTSYEMLFSIYKNRKENDANFASDENHVLVNGIITFTMR